MYILKQIEAAHPCTLSGIAHTVCPILADLTMHTENSKRICPVLRIEEGVEVIGIRGDKTDIHNVIVPHGVKRIKSNAFCDCKNLTSLILPDTLTAVDSGAFSECSRLTSLTLPKSLTSVGSNSFYSCGITSLTLPTGLNYIGRLAFAHSNITSITLPDTVSSIVFKCD